jgi:glycosyltransferase involved in cell wall biosynthesis
MGPDDEDETYAAECRQLAASLQAENIVFTGRIQTADYIGKMDMTLLTSISEGQPLTILESFAAKKPVIATNVGNCKGLIYGEADDFGAAGIVSPVLNVTQISQAILTLAGNDSLRESMGEIGHRRLLSRYTLEDMVGAYDRIYTTLTGEAAQSHPAGPKGR